MLLLSLLILSARYSTQKESLTFEKIKSSKKYSYKSFVERSEKYSTIGIFQEMIESDDDTINSLISILMDDNTLFFDFACSRFNNLERIMNKIKKKTSFQEKIDSLKNDMRNILLIGIVKQKNNYWIFSHNNKMLNDRLKIYSHVSIFTIVYTQENGFQMLEIKLKND